jgi:hypothetical protein
MLHEGGHFMFPSYMHQFYSNPYIPEAYLDSIPFPEENYYFQTERQMPTAPPPSYVPAQVETFAVDPGSIRRCLFRYTYVWLRGFEQFWFFPTFVGRTSVSGWRWTGFRWVFFGLSLRQIQSFTCF